MCLLFALPQVFKAGTAATDAQLLQLQDSSNSSSMWHSNGASAGQGAVSEYGLIEVDIDAEGAEEAHRVAAEQQQQQQYRRYEDTDDAIPVCKFFVSSTGCRRGVRCAFRHARPTCRFFLSRSGCMYGAACRFLHHTPGSSSSGGSSSSSMSPGGDTTRTSDDQQSQQGLTFDWDSSKAVRQASSIRGRTSEKQQQQWWFDIAAGGG
jgi:hypothetical protein